MEENLHGCLCRHPPACPGREGTTGCAGARPTVCPRVSSHLRNSPSEQEKVCDGRLPTGCTGASLLERISVLQA